MDDTPAEQAEKRQRFERDTWNQLTSIDLRLLEEMGWLSRQTHRRSPSGAYYCFPGRLWLGIRVGASTRTISRHLAKLARLGLLSKRQRRPRLGRWQSNLYRLIHPMAWAAARVRQMLTKCGDRRTQTAHIASSLKRREKDRGSAEALRAIIARGLAKFAPS
jgi:DNA-binding transcriptional ArsR family regulator